MSRIRGAINAQSATTFTQVSPILFCTEDTPLCVWTQNKSLEFRQTEPCYFIQE